MTGLPLYVLEAICPSVTLQTQNKEKFDGDWFAASVEMLEMLDK